MKIPLYIKCHNCGCEEYIFINLDESSFERKCKCGDSVSSFFNGSATVGHKILWRSNYELLQTKDYPLSIVFSATAVECELTRIYFKWNKIDSIGQNYDVTDEQLEAMLRKYRTVCTKIEEVSKLLYPSGLVSFVESSPELLDIINYGFPSLSVANLSRDFQKTLFWPRNRVLHLADADFSYDDAKHGFNIASLGLSVFGLMDKNRRTQY